MVRVAVVAGVIAMSSLVAADRAWSAPTCKVPLPPQLDDGTFYCGSWYLATQDESTATFPILVKLKPVASNRIDVERWYGNKGHYHDDAELRRSGEIWIYSSSGSFIKLIPNGDGVYQAEWFYEPSSNIIYERATLRRVRKGTESEIH